MGNPSKASIHKVENFKGVNIMIPIVVVVIGIAVVGSMLLETG